MRGNQDEQEEVFSYIPLEQRVPQDHPLRRVREMADRALQELSAWLDSLYARRGRPSIPPEQLLRAHTDPKLFAQWIGPSSLQTHIEKWDARSGGSWRGPCPLHGGTNPNFSVSPDKGLYHCFTCGESGTVFVASLPVERSLG